MIATILRSVHVATADGTRLVGPFELTVHAGRVLALVGESGSGKTLTLRTLAGFPPAGTQVISGVAGEVPQPVRAAIVFQDPTSFMNPRRTLHQSIREVIQAAQTDSDERELLQAVGLAADTGGRYPWQLSGGMAQRAALALALATQPQLLLADEFTSGLDEELQLQIMELVRDLVRRRDLACVFASHQLRLVAGCSDDVLVLYRGSVVESGPAATVLAQPRHHYTATMIAVQPSAATHGQALPELPTGRPVTQGCPFAPACDAVQERCRTVAPVATADGKRRFWCHFPLGGR